jgi:ankyrin repeat protein
LLVDFLLASFFVLLLLRNSSFSLQGGQTPFHLASRRGNVDILKILCNREPGVEMAKDKTGRSALHYACQYEGKGTAALKYLVCDVELKVDHCDQGGQTPFHLASRRGNVDILKILCNREPGVEMAKDKTGRSALHYACQYEGKGTAALKYLVCDVELKVDHCDQGGQTPFHLASRRGNVDILKILYNRKSGVAMAKDKTGRSALHYACQYEGKGTAALKYLVCDVELKVDHCDQGGQTPFHLASRRGNVDILKILCNREPVRV